MNILDTARMFPSLAAALSARHVEEETAPSFLREQMHGDGGSGRKAAAAFVLSLSDGALVDMRHAWAVWDKAHREAAISVLRSLT